MSENLINGKVPWAINADREMVEAIARIWTAKYAAKNAELGDELSNPQEHGEDVRPVESVII